VCFIDWPKTKAKFGHDQSTITGKMPVIVLCTECKNELTFKLSSIRPNHGKPFHPTCRSCKQRSVWKNQDYAQKQSEAQQRLTSERWQSDEYRAKVSSGIAAAHANNSTYHTQAVTALRSNEAKRLSNLNVAREGYRPKLANAARTNWNNPEYRAKLVEKLRSPGTKLKISAGVKAAWSRPEYTKAVLSNNKSKLEDSLAAVLDNLGVGYERQHLVGHWPFDFCVPGEPRSILVEVHGEYWHGARFENQRARDQAKATFVERYHSDRYFLSIWATPQEALQHRSAAATRSAFNLGNAPRGVATGTRLLAGSRRGPTTPPREPSRQHQIKKVHKHQPLANQPSPSHP